MVKSIDFPAVKGRPAFAGDAAAVVDRRDGEGRKRRRSPSLAVRTR